MKLMIFSGEHKRYRHLVNEILVSYPDATLVVQRSHKGDYIGKHNKNKNLNADAIALNNRHLKWRDTYENRYYSSKDFNKDIDLEVTAKTLNSKKVIDLIMNEVKPNVVFTFGVDVLKKQTLNAMQLAHDCRCINLHFGLSPYYKGTDTLLWPLYLQHPNHIGFTLHEITLDIDGGDIYVRKNTVFKENDWIHDIFCKTILQAIEPTVNLIEDLMEGRDHKPVPQEKRGKTYYNGEFTPQHMLVIYKTINDMLDDYFAGKRLAPDIKEIP